MKWVVYFAGQEEILLLESLVLFNLKQTWPFTNICDIVRWKVNLCHHFCETRIFIYLANSLVQCIIWKFLFSFNVYLNIFYLFKGTACQDEFSCIFIISNFSLFKKIHMYKILILAILPSQLCTILVVPPAFLKFLSWNVVYLFDFVIANPRD